VHRSSFGFAIGGLALVALAGCSHDANRPPAPTGDAATADAASDAPTDATGDQLAPGLDAQMLPEAGPRCGGDFGLCDKVFSEVSFLGTHLSMATAAAWPVQTQGRATLDQILQGGVRVLELEVHDDDGALALCEGSCSAQSVSLVSTLTPLAGFLEQNPSDLLVLVLRSAVPASALAPAFDQAGLSSLALAQELDKPWPKLADMVAKNERVVVLVDELANDSPDGGLDASAPDPGVVPPYLLPLRDSAWESAVSESTDCPIAHGSASLKLAILNHYVPGEAADDAGLIAAHTSDTVATRLARCATDHGHAPNFMLVDFAEVGDPNGGVQLQNGTR
jgi:hypothetical protein